ncbi:MAG: DUF433 domain-containing protein [bacterium]
MAKDYVERRDDGYWIAGTRVSLDSVVLAFLEGLSPETIVAECFPVLTLEQAYGAISYYLAHRRDVDASLQAAEAEFEARREASRSAEPEFYRKLAAARRQMPHAAQPGMKVWFQADA